MGNEEGRILAFRGLCEAPFLARLPNTPRLTNAGLLPFVPIGGIRISSRTPAAVSGSFLDGGFGFQPVSIPAFSCQ